MLRFRLLLGFALAWPLSTQGQDGRISISFVESLIRSQQYDQALATLKTALDKSPTDFKLWTLEGICFALQGKDPDALAAFEHAIHIAPDYTPALRGEVQILYKTGDKRAVPLLERMLKNDPADVTGHEMLGMFEKRAGNCHAAVSQFLLSKEVLAEHPESLEAYGYCLVELKQTAEAIPVFRQLIPLVPGRTYPSYDLAVLLVSSHDYEGAVQVLEPLLTQGQSDPDIFSLASEAYEGTGNTPKAVGLQRQAIVLDPSDASNYVSFAALCLTHDSFQVGIDMLDAGLKRIAGNSSLYLSRGVLYVQLAEFDKADADFKMAEQLGAAQSLGAYAGDLTVLQKNDPESALVRIRGQLKVHPNSPLLLLLLARLLMNEMPEPHSPAFNEAMQAALAAEKSKPDVIEAHNLLGTMYMTLKQYDKAVKESRTALQYDPSDETAMYHLLISLRRSGQSDDLQPLVKRLSEMHQESLRRETERKRYRLVEQQSPTTPADGVH